MSWLDELQELSQKRKDGGLIHCGIIHYIQQRFGDKFDEAFILKASIYGVLENVPNPFPKHLPELVEKPDFKATEEMNKAFRKINKNVIMPIQGGEIAEIIRLARQYEKEG